MLFLFLIVLVAVEGFVRIYEYTSIVCPNIESEAFADVDPLTRKQICNDHNQLEFIHPSIMLIKPDQYFSTININSHGFRGSEFNLEKPDDVYRIFVIGGSSMFGSGATSDEKTIPGFLQNEFNESKFSKKIQVINAGIGSATSFQETFLIKNYLRNFEPDLFIIFDGNNDSHFHYFADRTLNPTVKDLEKSDNFVESLKFKNFQWYRTPFILNKLLSDTISNPTDDNTKKIELHEIKSNIAEKWTERWAGICQLGKKDGFNVIITLQPILGSGNKPLSSFEKYILETDKEIPETLIVLDELALSLKNLENDCNNVYDLREIFDTTDSPVFWDNVHTNDYGNYIIAKNLFELSTPIIANDLE